MQRSFLSMATAAAASRMSITPCLALTSTSLSIPLRRWSSNNTSGGFGGGFSGTTSGSANLLSPPTPHSISPYHVRPTQRQNRYQNTSSSSNSRSVRSSHAQDDSGQGDGNGYRQEIGRGPTKDRLPPLPTDLVDPRRRLAVLVDGSNSNLISGDSTSLEQIYRSSALFSTVLPAVLQVGVPVLLRVFAHQLPSAWEPLIAGNANTMRLASATVGEEELNDRRHGDEEHAMEMQTRTSSHGTPFTLVPLPNNVSLASAADQPAQPRIQVEYFRVERFIPVAMQIEADARHLYEFRTLNKVEGVCYVCHEVDRAMYVSLMQEQRSGSSTLAGLLQRNGNSGSATTEAAAFFNQYVFDELGIADELLTDGRSKDGS